MNKLKLERLYIHKKLSVKDIADRSGCSENKINYWLKKLNIKKRTISEALYQMNNPKGDPFSFTLPKDAKNMFIFGLGLGLFWGEGTKKDTHSVRLCNSDPFLIKTFINFLTDMYKINKNKLRFQLQTYDDMNEHDLILFWMKFLSVQKTQFYKTTILKRRGEGTYRRKMKYGVIIICFNNKKLRDLICGEIEKLSQV